MIMDPKKTSKNVAHSKKLEETYCGLLWIQKTTKISYWSIWGSPSGLDHPSPSDEAPTPADAGWNLQWFSKDIHRYPYGFVWK